jgi:hypothetical protein
VFLLEVQEPRTKVTQVVTAATQQAQDMELVEVEVPVLLDQLEQDQAEVQVESA